MSEIIRPKGVLSRNRIWIPLLISLSVASFIFWISFDPEAYRSITWTSSNTLWLLAGFMFMLGRISLYAYRLRLASDHSLSILQSYQIAILWDFASAVTPSTVGGSAVAVFLLNREQESFGKSTAMVMLVSFLDQLFYVVVVPILLIVVGTEMLFPATELCERSNQLSTFIDLSSNLWGLFIAGYCFLLLIVCLLGYGLFINPEGLKRFYLRVMRWRIFKKWWRTALKTGDDIVTASAHYKQQKFSFWFKISLVTILAWTCRFCIACCIILAFTGEGDQVVVFGRQFVLWIIMLIPSTPGSTGIADLAFIGMLCEFIPAGLEGVISQTWRFMTYYSWAIIGALILPMWLRRTAILKIKAQRKEEKQKDE